jgi:hypothetical protein
MRQGRMMGVRISRRMTEQDYGLNLKITDYGWIKGQD